MVQPPRKNWPVPAVRLRC